MVSTLSSHSHGVHTQIAASAYDVHTQQREHMVFILDSTELTWCSHSDSHPHGVHTQIATHMVFTLRKQQAHMVSTLR